MMEEKEFIQQINAKKIEAYRELFHSFYRYLVLYAMRLVQQQEIAEDIVQETFIHIWKSPKEYNSFHGFRSFLYESVKNGCLNSLKHKKIEQDYETYLLHSDHTETGETEDYELMREEIYRKLYQAIEKLPPGCRKIFKEHLAGKKNEEIARCLQLSVETVKTQKKKAVRLLRQELGDSYVLLIFLLKILP